MADAKFEEVIRLAFETAGTDGIKQAASIMAGLGDVSEETRKQAAALLDDIGNVEKSSAAVRQYGEISKSVLDYQRQISAARSKVLELATAVKAADEPTKAQQRELAKARTTLSELVGEQQRQLGTLRTLKAGLDAQGISTRSAAASQRDLAARTAAASANLREMVTDLKRTREADAALQASLAAAAQKSKAETDQYDAALKKVRTQLDENKNAAVHGAGETTAGLTATRSAVDKLRGALAGLAAYFSFQAIGSGIKSLLGTGDQFEKFQKQLTNIYGDAAKGGAAFEWVKQFAKDTPLQLDQVMQSFIKLKNFGIDPMSGALQAAVDQNAKLGGESERLERITLAMGQAFAKGKLQGDDIKQMIEAGVPVWQILSEVTGKNVQQLQKMSEAGALGKDVMQAFFAQMGRDAAGAAADQMATLSGQFSNLQDNIQQFQDRVAKKGVLDYFKDQLAKLNDLIGKMAADGRLDAYAQRISDGIISLAQTLKSATAFLIEHASAIKDLAKAYVGFKLGKIVVEVGAFAVRLASLTKNAVAAGAAARGLSVGMAVLRGAMILLSGPIGWVIGGLTAFAAVTKLAADRIVDYALKHNQAAEDLKKSNAKQAQALQDAAAKYGLVAKSLEQYANVHVLAAEEVAKLSTAERAAYKERLEGHAAYVEAQRQEAGLMVTSGTASEAWAGHLEKVNAEQQKTTQGLKDFAAGTELSAAAAAQHMSVGAASIQKNLGDVKLSAEDAKNKMEAEFAEFGKKTPEQMGDLALAVANLGAQSGPAGEAIRRNLHDNLTQITSEDLLNFQKSGDNAFIKFETSAKEAAVITEATLQVALATLGVSAEQWGLKTTLAGQDNIRAFQLVATNASASAETIEAAFNKALAKASTADDAKAIGDAIKEAGEKGKVGFDATERAVKAVQDRLAALKNAVDPLAESFAVLGIQSQRSLDAAAAKAKHAFDNIVRGSRDGTASMNDVRAAFDGYAKAQLAAVEHAETWRRSQVQSALSTQASILGVSDEMAKLGAAGIAAGDSIAQGQRVAQTSLGETAKAASEAEQTTEEAADKAEKYGEKMANAHQAQARQWVATGARTQVAINGMSDAFLQALANLNQLAVGSQNLWRNAWNGTVAEWRRQGEEVDKQIQDINRQNAAYDEMAKRVDTLRQKYNFLNDDQLRALAQAQQTLEENQKRAEEEVRRKRDAAMQKNKDDRERQTAEWNKELGIDGSKPAAPGAGGEQVHRHVVDLSVSASQTPGAVPAQLSPTDVQKIANEVVRVIGIARSSSN